MSWICEVCSTNNDEKDIECFVCGTARSEASIREGRIRAREEKTRKFEDNVYKNGMFVLKLGFILSAALMVVAVIIKVAQGTLFTDIEENGGFFISTMIDNSLRFCEAGIRFWGEIVLTEKSEFFALYFGNLNIAEAFSAALEIIGEGLILNINVFVDNVKFAFGESDSVLAFEPMMDRMCINLEATGGVLDVVSTSMNERFGFAESFCSASLEKVAVSFAFVGVLVSEVIHRINKNTTYLIENVLKVTSKFIR